MFFDGRDIIIYEIVLFVLINLNLTEFLDLMINFWEVYILEKYIKLYYVGVISKIKFCRIL